MNGTGKINLPEIQARQAPRQANTGELGAAAFGSNGNAGKTTGSAGQTHVHGIRERSSSPEQYVEAPAVANEPEPEQESKPEPSGRVLAEELDWQGPLAELGYEQLINCRNTKPLPLAGRMALHDNDLNYARLLAFQSDRELEPAPEVKITKTGKTDSEEGVPPTVVQVPEAIAPVLEPEPEPEPEQEQGGRTLADTGNTEEEVKQLKEQLENQFKALGQWSRNAARFKESQLLATYIW